MRPPRTCIAFSMPQVSLLFSGEQEDWYGDDTYDQYVRMWLHCLERMDLLEPAYCYQGTWYRQYVFQTGLEINFRSQPQLDGKMWMIFPTNLKCRIYVSLSSPQCLIISNTVRNTNYVCTSKIDGIPVHEILCPYTTGFSATGTWYQVPVKNCCDPLSSPICLISSTKPIPCLARIKLACLVNQRSQQVVDLSIFSLKVEVLRYEPFYVDKICR